MKRFDLPGSNRSGATFTANVICLIGVAMAFGCATVRPANVLPSEAIDAPVVEIVEAIAPELPTIHIQSMDEKWVHFRLRNQTNESFHFTVFPPGLFAYTEAFVNGRWLRSLAWFCGLGSVPTTIQPEVSVTSRAYRQSTEFPVRVRMSVRRGPASESKSGKQIVLTSGSSADMSKQ
ncbi:MAG: hypothetical protein ACI8TQ_003229 [Planctomycetota bacterium]